MKFIKKIQNKAEEAGWKGMPSALYKSAYHRIKYFSSTFYLKNVLQNKMLAKAYPFKKPVILLFGKARSGTSWTGKILSFSPNLAYMREPVTQSFIQKYNYKPSLFGLESKDGNENFKKLADHSFAGIPPLPNVIKNRPDFFSFTRSKRSLLIKEVTFNILGYYMEHYTPKIIILLRHPAGILDSFMRMGWLKDSFEEFGHKYGVRMSKVIKITKGRKAKVKCYENIAKNPTEEFLELYDFMEVKEPAYFDLIIDEFCNQKNREWQPYQTKRASDDEVYKWKQNLDVEVIKAVRKGYLRSDLSYYRDEEDWCI